MRRLGLVVVAALLLGGCAFQPGEEITGESGDGNEELMRNEGAISSPGGGTSSGSKSPTDAQQRRESIKDRLNWAKEPEPTPWQGGSSSGGTGGSGGSSGSGE